MEKRTRILFSTGIETDRPDCYSKGWSEYILDLLTFEEVNIGRIEAEYLRGEGDFVILVGPKWSEDSPGYDKLGVSPHELFFTYRRLLAAGFSYDDALAELLRFYEAEPFFSEPPKSFRHADNWGKRYIIPKITDDRELTNNKALTLETQRWVC